MTHDLARIVMLKYDSYRSYLGLVDVKSWVKLR